MISTLPNPTTRDFTVPTPRKHFQPGSQRPWTPEDDALLTACAVAGMTQRQAAYHLGRSVVATSARAAARGISFLRLRVAGKAVL
jgi:hypothetical protein